MAGSDYRVWGSRASAESPGSGHNLPEFTPEAGIQRHHPVAVANRAAEYIATMLVYAGIDEAGYGPFFGPMVMVRTVWTVTEDRRPATDGQPSGKVPDLWQRLSDGVTRENRDPEGRIAIDDSKKVHSGKHGHHHLERGVLAMAGAVGGDGEPAVQTLEQWLALQPEPQTLLPWYIDGDGDGLLPRWITRGQADIARAMLARSLDRSGVRLGEIAIEMLLEDRFNQLVRLSGNKGALGNMLAARHLAAIWRSWGHADPRVVVDRLGGRAHYLRLLGDAVPEARIQVALETNTRSVYRLTEADAEHVKQRAQPFRSMWVSFEVEADSRHLPVAAASMGAKYTRELLMERFSKWFAARLPDIRPTAGYGSDAKRFWLEIQPHLQHLGIDPLLLRRQR
ncbi:MAG: hypothetical protein JJU36_08680 [Phycisphaeraceae bacterium]|nr:hypothetical protein [Phycisphaeraceae bacterium]